MPILTINVVHVPGEPNATKEPTEQIVRSTEAEKAASLLCQVLREQRITLCVKINGICRGTITPALLERGLTNGNLQLVVSRESIGGASDAFVQEIQERVGNELVLEVPEAKGKKPPLREEDSEQEWDYSI